MDVKTKQKQTKLKETCDACGLPKSDIRGTSLTGWIFGKSCHCITASDAKNDQVGDADVRPLTDINERYETLEVIGSGGMGTVYRVKDRSLDKVFALKVLRPELANDKEAVVRFKQEISAAQNLSHANLVTVYDWGLSTEGSPYFVMDYVDGISLADLLKSEKTLGLQRCINMMLQVCEALAHAHEHGIVHRDLKPSNIIVTCTDDGTECAKVVDFGIAKILPPPGKDTVSLTKTAEIFGSPAYMSPEQCKGERIDRRCDIYAFGCVMFECLIGQPPFARENPVKTILAHIYDQPPSVRSKLIGYSAPDEVAAVINKCLSKDPTDRYDSIKDLEKDIECLRDGQPPLALTSISKEKRRRQLKLLGFTYFPQVLTLLTIVILLMAIQDSPWLLALAELNQPERFHSKMSRVELTNQLVAKADDYNKPYALFMAAEADMETGLLEEAHDKAIKSVNLFKERKNLPDTLLASRLLFSEYLRENNIQAARALAKEMNELQFAGFNKAPKKGMRLLGWFYLPCIPGTLADMQSLNVDSLIAYRDIEGAELIIDDSLAALKRRESGTTSKSELAEIKTLENFWRAKKILLMLHSGRQQVAGVLFDSLTTDCAARGSIIAPSRLDPIAYQFLSAGDVTRAQRALQLIPSENRYQDTDRDLLRALCHSLKGNSKEADVFYEKASLEMIDHWYWSDRSPNKLTRLAGAAVDATGSSTSAIVGIDLFFGRLLTAVDRLNSTPDSAKSQRSLWPSEAEKKKIDYRERLPHLKIQILNEYATALSLNGYKQRVPNLRQQAEKLINLGENNFLKYQIGYGYMLDGNASEANRLIRSAIDSQIDRSKSTKIEPRDTLLVASTIALSGDTNRAETLLKELIKEPTTWNSFDRSDALTALGNIALSKSDLIAAENYYKQSLENVPTSFTDDDLAAYNRIQLAQINLRKGQIDAGLEWFKHGLVQANSALLQERLLQTHGTLLRKKGDIKGATEILDRVTALKSSLTTGDIMEEKVSSLRYRIPRIDFIAHPSDDGLPIK